MSDTNRDISQWTQSGTIERCGVFEERDGMPAKFWASMKSEFGTRTRYLKLQAWGDVATDAGRQLTEGTKVVVSGKHGATKGKEGQWSDCLDFNSFVLVGSLGGVNESSEPVGDDDEIPF